MSDHQPTPDSEEPADLAAEYVLGVLDAEARARAAERISRDPVFRAEVEAWETRLAPLLDGVAPVDPPARLWTRLESALAPPATVLPFRPRPRAWSQVAVWRAATAGLAAAVAGLVIVIAVRPTQVAPPASAAPPPAPGPVLTASLATSGGKVLWVAVIDPSRKDVTIIPVRGLADAGRSPELWIIPVGGKPRPVGVFAGGQMSMPSSALAVAEPKETLAVSLEPIGGSRTGAPTGPVVATGALVIS